MSMLPHLGLSVWAGLLLATATPALERVEPHDLYRAGRLKLFPTQRDLAQEKLNKSWDFSDGTTGRFTHFSPEAVEPQVTDKVLRFRTDGDKVVIGWGNFENREPEGQRLHLWPGWNSIELRVKQSAANSKWTLSLWQDGRRSVVRRGRDFSKDTEELKGADWQTLSFLVQMPDPDGFGITIEGSTNNVIEIDSVRIVQKALQGYFRREFELPRGEVWRAVAEVGRKTTLYVNGREIPFGKFAPNIFATCSVDLSPHLKRGRNCIALSAHHHPGKLDLAYPGNPALAYFQGKVVMSTGEAVVLDVPDSWLASKDAQDGWAKAGFDDGAWQAAELDAAVRHTHLWYRWPGYDGRLVLENPSNDPKLFFIAREPLIVNVRVPEGLAERKPVLNWVLRRVHEIGKPEEDLARGSVTSFASRPGASSLLYQVEAGLQPRGVHTLEVNLQAGGNVIESRVREPLIVVGRIPMKEVRGDTYEDGMTLTLEDTIDFVDPKDPHPWVESKRPRGPAPAEGVATPRITRKNGLVYRETGIGVSAGSSAFFSYRFAFRKPDSFYLMVLEYPNDADRAIGVGVTALDQMAVTPRGAYTSQSGPAVITGHQFPITGKMEQLRWVHYAYSKEQTLEVVSLSKKARAAASRVRIYRIEELPALKCNRSGERFFGLHTERARSLPKLYGGNMPTWYLYDFQKLKLDMVGHVVHRLRWHLHGAENYTRYLRFAGQNLHVMGAFQYNENNNSYIPPERIPTARILNRAIREVALRVFEQNDIAMMSMVEYCSHQALGEDFAVSDSQVAAGADTIAPVSRHGKQAGVWGCVQQANFHHSAVQDAYLRVIDDLALKFSHSLAWKGVYLMVYPAFSGPCEYARTDGPFEFDYSDAAIAAFEKDTGVRVPGRTGDAKRFGQRYEFLMSEKMRGKWIDWRCRAVRPLVLKTRDTLQKHRRDLQVLYGYYINPEGVMYDWCDTGRPYFDVIRNFGMDPRLYREDRDVWFGRYFYPNEAMRPLQGYRGSPKMWEHCVNKEVIDAYDRDVNRFVVMNTCWHEIRLLAPGCSKKERTPKPPAPGDWPIPEWYVRYVSHHNGANARETFTQALIGADPEVVMFGFTDVMFPMGHEQELREFSRVLTALPKGRFAPVGETTDFKHNFAIRDLRRDGEYWFYVANPGYWSIKGTVTLDRVSSVHDPVTGQAVAARVANGKTVVPIELKGYGVAAFRVTGGASRPRTDLAGVRIRSWRNDPVPDEDLAHLRGIIADVRRLLAAPKIAATISETDRTFLAEATVRAEASLADGRYAEAWLQLRNWRLWILWREKLREEEANVAAGFATSGSKARARTAVPKLAASPTSTPPVIDGDLADAVWQAAAASTDFVSMSASLEPLGAPRLGTSVKVTYDREKLYLALAMDDPDPGALQKVARRADEIFDSHDDAVVIFLQPGGKKLFQFAVSAGALRQNADVTGRTRAFRAQDTAFKGGWEAAVGKSGKAWTVELALPFSTLAAHPPKPGAEWRANFLRRFRQFRVPEMYWSAVKSSWYDVERYGRLRFR